jgi:hypothetical protein
MAVLYPGWLIGGILEKGELGSYLYMNNQFVCYIFISFFQYMRIH